MAKRAFVFPGQASQYVGMGLDFFNTSPVAQKYYRDAEPLFGFSLKEYSFYGPLKELTQTKVTQPAIFIHSLIVMAELKAKGLHPDMVAGHSLGEYTALVAAESISFQEGLQLVKVRSEQMQKATDNSVGTMAAIVGLSYEQIQKTLIKAGFSGICNIANYNSPNQIVISGDVHTVQSVMLELKAAGAKRVIELSVGGAFHSPLMQEAGDRLKEALDATRIQPPRVPIYFNVTGTSTQDPDEIRAHLYHQLTSPVLWVNSIENMIRDGANSFLEVGPGRVLQGLIRRINSDITVAGVSNVEELAKLQ